MFPSGDNVYDDIIIDTEEDWSWTMGECNELTHAFLDRLEFAVDRVVR